MSGPTTGPTTAADVGGAASVAPVRIGIVGAGGIAKAYAEILGGAFAVPAVAGGVADVRTDAAEAMAGPLGVPAFVSAAAMADALAGSIDAVVVCTPPVTHAALAADFGCRGVHVLCEKPLALHRAEAEAMVARAATDGIVLGMPTKFRYCADIVAAGELMTNGKLGDIRLVENAFTSRVDMSTRWNSDPAVSGGGVLMDNGTHSVDLLRFLLGPLREILAVEQARPGTMQVDDCARLHVRTVSGVDASVDLAWSIDKSLPYFLNVYGTEGEARVGWGDGSWRTISRSGVGEWTALGGGYAKFPAMGGALAQFCLAVRGVEPLKVTGADAIAAAAAIEAAYESLAKGGWAQVV